MKNKKNSKGKWLTANDFLIIKMLIDNGYSSGKIIGITNRSYSTIADIKNSSSFEEYKTIGANRYKAHLQKLEEDLKRKEKVNSIINDFKTGKHFEEETRELEREFAIKEHNRKLIQEHNEYVLQKINGNKQEMFETESLMVASALNSFYTLKTMRNVNGKITFGFDKTKELEETLSNFWQKKLFIDALTYFEVIKNLKARIFDILEK